MSYLGNAVCNDDDELRLTATEMEHYRWVMYFSMKYCVTLVNIASNLNYQSLPLLPRFQ